MSTFYDRFLSRRAYTRSVLCVGLDPDSQLQPEKFRSTETMVDYLLRVVEATAPFAAAFKPNIAFFEAQGPVGWQSFARLVEGIRRISPEALIIADAKRGDLANTSRFYARAFFDEYGCDGVTVNPYMGMDSLEPYFAFAERGVFALCLTSNPGAADFQLHGTPPLFERVASFMEKQNQKTHNVWMVAGATKSVEQLSRIRSIAPTVPFLVPGIGAQGGDLAAVLSVTGAEVLVNASRSILYADAEGDFAAGAEKAARGLAEQMRALLPGLEGSV